MTLMKKPLPTARELALNILQGVESRRGYSNYLLQEAYRKYPMNLQEKGLLKQLVGGVLRQRGKLDWALNQLTDQRFRKTQPLLRNILRLGAYQLLSLQGIACYAAVNESVLLARKFSHKGSAALVNAVLRRLSKLKDCFHFPSLEEGPVTFLSVNYSHPEWLVTRWLERWGARQTQAICQAANRPPTVGLRVNTLKVNVEECRNFLQREGIVTRVSPLVDDVLEVEKGLDLFHSQAYEKGWIEIQSTVSASVAHLLAPRPGDRVLDLCAGRGVKSTHLAQLMANQGQITALDIYPHKLRQLQANCRRLGVQITKPLAADATADLPLDPALSFERILLDAPCSGLGVLGRYPEARWQKQAPLIGKMQTLQRKLLKQAANHLSKGGVLVYAACSLEPEENEQVIENFLAAHSCWRLVPIKADGDEGDGYRRSWFQGDLPLGDGFFIAKLSKEG